ncbi:low molecular weight protein tyrosine phosphatase family protein [Aliikangiella coralliicola]|uniref:Phosphotyrosine protein phosphatase n=1 Tax=Aliikangiella coralliicola TaxID=2592383 RepID=A0A545UEV9_9GAMM|nr:phosphotyrosine protein phosphatase [Aliikangiella coralliicola]TQV88010.1 phosphotyrosine protein phosphatase [Aliikangiella coralliicola]
MQNLLFICSRNQWRSPTAEEVWRKHPEFNVRSAGTSPKARKTVSSSDIRWADVVFVMEQKHKNRLRAEFTRMLDHKPVYVSDIPDEYKFMDEELIDELKDSVNGILDSLS